MARKKNEARKNFRSTEEEALPPEDESEEIEEEVEEDEQEGEVAQEDEEEEEEEEEETLVLDEVARCKCRSSLYRIHTAFKKMAIDANSDLKKEIGRTPFGFLLACPNVTTNNALLTALVMMWDGQLQGFRICGRLVPFTVEDVAFITGLRNEGREVVIPNEGEERDLDAETIDSSSCKSHFEIKFGKSLTTRTIVEDYLVDLGRLPTVVAVRAWVFYVLGAILFPSTNQYVSLKWCTFADSFGELLDFNWCGALHESITTGLNAAKGSIVDRPNAKTTHVKSCVIILMAWAYIKLGNYFKPEIRNPPLLSLPTAGIKKYKTYLEMFRARKNQAWLDGSYEMLAGLEENKLLRERIAAMDKDMRSMKVRLTRLERRPDNFSEEGTCTADARDDHAPPIVGAEDAGDEPDVVGILVVETSKKGPNVGRRKVARRKAKSKKRVSEGGSVPHSEIRIELDGPSRLGGVVTPSVLDIPPAGTTAEEGCCVDVSDGYSPPSELIPKSQPKRKRKAPVSLRSVPISLRSRARNLVVETQVAASDEAQETSDNLTMKKKHVAASTKKRKLPSTSEPLPPEPSESLTPSDPVPSAAVASPLPNEADADPNYIQPEVVAEPVAAPQPADLAPQPADLAPQPTEPVPALHPAESAPQADEPAPQPTEPAPQPDEQVAAPHEPDVAPQPTEPLPALHPGLPIAHAPTLHPPEPEACTAPPPTTIKTRFKTLARKRVKKVT